MKLLGLDLGGTKILGVLADEHGNMLNQHLEPTQAHEGFGAVVDRVASVLKSLLPEGGVDAIGVDVPAPVDSRNGLMYDAPNLPGWPNDGVPLMTLLKERMGASTDSVPFALLNDANASALAEYTFGAGSEKVLGRKIEDMIFMTVSTGIGGGAIVAGKLLTGANGFAAEFGHTVIDAFGERCLCGNVGCLEAMASGTALGHEAQIMAAARPESMMAALAGGDPEKVDARIVEQAAKAGDPVAMKLIEREATLLGAGITTFIHTFNPQLIVIGGGVSYIGDMLFNPVREEVARRVMTAYKGTYEIVPSRLGTQSAALGAVAAARLLVNG